MAEEPRKDKREFKDTYRYLAIMVRWAAWGVCCVLLLSSASIASQVDQVQIATVYSPELSVPLWGGVAAVSSFLQTPLPAHEINLHHFDQVPCGNCHEAPDSTDDSASTGWRDGVDVNRACTSSGCHEYDEKMNHPINVPLPTGMTNGELSPSGTVTCLSCHRPELSANLDSQTDRMLQAPEQVGCDSCHMQFSGSTGNQSHWKFSQKAHLVTIVPGSTYSKSGSDFTGLDIDMESSTCLSCHDEVNASIPAMNQAGRRGVRGFTGTSDHPIGMDYQSVLANNTIYYNSLRSDQNRIRMFDGKVGCGSCHSLYSDSPSHLAVDNTSSTLCNECHNR